MDDVRSGVGRHVNKHGEEYKGQWKHNERCGRGRCLYARQPDFKPPPPGFTSVAVSTLTLILTLTLALALTLTLTLTLSLTRSLSRSHRRPSPPRPI